MFTKDSFGFNFRQSQVYAVSWHNLIIVLFLDIDVIFSRANSFDNNLRAAWQKLGNSLARAWWACWLRGSLAIVLKQRHCSLVVDNRTLCCVFEITMFSIRRLCSLNPQHIASFVYRRLVWQHLGSSSSNGFTHLKGDTLWALHPLHAKIMSFNVIIN